MIDFCIFYSGFIGTDSFDKANIFLPVRMAARIQSNASNAENGVCPFKNP